MLLEPDRTPYDLSWRMFDIPIRVHPMFWLVSGIMGFNLIDLGFPYFILWIVCVFVSVLIHEMGHVLVGRIFGAEGSIVLYSFGGLAIGSSGLNNRWQRIAVYLAGPFAEFFFFGLVLIGYYLIPKEEGSPFIRMAVNFLFQINLFWGALNLLPILPLDGGQISRELFTWFLPRNGLRYALMLSIGAAVLLGVASLMLGMGMFMLLFFGMLAMSSYQMLQQTGPSSQPWQVDHPDDYDRYDSWDRNRRDDRYR